MHVSTCDFACLNSYDFVVCSVTCKSAKMYIKSLPLHPSPTNDESHKIAPQCLYLTLCNSEIRRISVRYIKFSSFPSFLHRIHLIWRTVWPSSASNSTWTPAPFFVDFGLINFAQARVFLPPPPLGHENPPRGFTTFRCSEALTCPPTSSRNAQGGYRFRTRRKTPRRCLCSPIG